MQLVTALWATLALMYVSLAAITGNIRCDQEK